METTRSNRTRKVTIRFSETEFKTLQERSQNTTCRKLSEYVRKLLFGKPVTTLTRDRSMDDIARELIGLKTELNRIGNNYNQVVQKMHTLKTVPQFEIWHRTYEATLPVLFGQIRAIQSCIQKTAEKWLQ